ncbi:prepilin-type N-terminal cleavage/methylation domain-containing protein [Candidatus Wolfebacteria bacterium]|nr:prepilin-type N-terminal cleavage/methylation domain-containing protein [Candidatus Wolfebacteria bacterium]
MKKGFTLIELLIVIGILAVLAVAVVLVLNPAELLAQARDSQRISDLSSIKSAIGFYLATAASPALGEAARCTVACAGGLPADGPFNLESETTNAGTAVDGSGWVGVALTGATGGSPLATLPLDPSQTATYFYAYDGNNTAKTFELNGRLESNKFRVQMTSDGGDNNTCVTYVEDTCYYELGTEPGLDF